MTVTEDEDGTGRQVARIGSGEGSGPFTVLYVEDHPINIELVRRLVARRAWVRLEVARTGAQALDLVELAPPGLVLLDLHLPDISGELVLERVWARPGCGEIPVVVLSADAVAETADRLLSRGVREFLTKPLDVARFYACLDDAAAAATAAAAVPSPRRGHRPGRAR